MVVVNVTLPHAFADGDGMYIEFTSAASGAARTAKQQACSETLALLLLTVAPARRVHLRKTVPPARVHLKKSPRQHATRDKRIYIYASHPSSPRGLVLPRRQEADPIIYPTVTKRPVSETPQCSASLLRCGRAKSTRSCRATSGQSWRLCCSPKASYLFSIKRHPGVFTITTDHPLLFCKTAGGGGGGETVAACEHGRNDHGQPLAARTAATHHGPDDHVSHNDNVKAFVKSGIKQCFWLTKTTALTIDPTFSARVYVFICCYTTMLVR